MNAKIFFHALGQIDDKYIEKAINYQPRRKSRSWIKWGAVAACLCLVIGVGVLTIPNEQSDPIDGQGTMEQVYTLPQAETMSVELVEWSVDRFKGIVVDVGNNSVFPADAELSVVFDYDTEILLDDGTLMVFNPDEPDIGAIGWKEGTIVNVEFVNYHAYQEGNHFYNQVYASHVEIKE